MKLLILTQKVDINDDVLGFFHRWIEEFAKHCEKVTVICLQKGEYNLPKNVKVLSLGKEKGRSKIKYLFNFYKYIFRERKNYDAVFVHMNPEYVVLGGIFWRLMGKKVGLWYVHRQVNLKLKIAEKLADEVFTVSKESFRVKSKKINILGHGIDVEYFSSGKEKEKNSNTLNILYVGRISRIKNCDVLIKAGKILKEKLDKDFKIRFVGAPISKEDERYFKEIKSMVKALDLENNVEFIGSVPNKDIKWHYFWSDIVVNMSPTGGKDKVILEAIAAKRLILFSNKAFLDHMPQNFYFKLKDCNDLAEKIISLSRKKALEVGKMVDFLHNKVTEKANLKNLIKKILQKLK